METTEAPPKDETRRPVNVLFSVVVATFVISIVGTFIATLTLFRQNDTRKRITQLENQVGILTTTGNLDGLKAMGLELDDVLKDLDAAPPAGPAETPDETPKPPADKPKEPGQ